MKDGIHEEKVQQVLSEVPRVVEGMQSTSNINPLATVQPLMLSLVTNVHPLGNPVSTTTPSPRARRPITSVHPLGSPVSTTTPSPRTTRPITNMPPLGAHRSTSSLHRSSRQHTNILPPGSHVPNQPHHRSVRHLSATVTGNGQQAVKVRTEAVDDASASKRRRHRSSNSEQPSTSGGSVRRIKSEGGANQGRSNENGSQLSAIHELLATIQRPINEDQIYGEHLACELRAIKDPVVKRRCRCAISQIMLNALKEDSLQQD